MYFISREDLCKKNPFNLKDVVILKKKNKNKDRQNLLKKTCLHSKHQIIALFYVMTCKWKIPNSEVNGQ